MISQTNSSMLRAAYPNKASDSKEIRPNATLSKEGEADKIEKLKDSIGSGEYKVNIQALSEKMADSLL